MKSLTVSFLITFVVVVINLTLSSPIRKVLLTKHKIWNYYLYFAGRGREDFIQNLVSYLQFELVC